ncbi:hypothetical protein NDU88_006188 [Pleurodeles waltl]|uniref:Uncharacterized protein n=1 Tax=Pleurodeles waltl TaxID=8319 RepID=A0AAV7WDZ1_PLEWA|nr:hypothetical protein NDU88_006188 [Pleurodeles waltl]
MQEEEGTTDQRQLRGPLLPSDATRERCRKLQYPEETTSLRPARAPSCPRDPARDRPLGTTRPTKSEHTLTSVHPVRPEALCRSEGPEALCRSEGPGAQKNQLRAVRGPLSSSDVTRQQREDRGLTTEPATTTKDEQTEAALPPGEALLACRADSVAGLTRTPRRASRWSRCVSASRAPPRGYRAAKAVGGPATDAYYEATGNAGRICLQGSLVRAHALRAERQR